MGFDDSCVISGGCSEANCEALVLLLFPKSDLWDLLLGDLSPFFLEDEDDLMLVLFELLLTFSPFSPALPGLEALDFTFFLGRYL